MMNEGYADDEGYLNSEIYGEDIQDTQIPETQENEEGYRVDIDNQTRNSNEFTPTPPINMFQNQASRASQQGRVRRESATNRVAGGSQVSSRNGSRGGRRKQSFQATLADTMAGFREFQRQSLQQMRPNSFDQEDYDECEMAIKIFESLEVQKNSGFYWACIQALKDERFWRKHFIDRADDSDEDKLQFLQALTGYTRDGEYVGKRLNSNQNCSSPNFGVFASGGPSFGTNNSWGQTPNGQWSHGSQQWGTPPNAQQWGSSSSIPQWGTPPNAQHWGPSSSVPQWGTPPNAQQRNTPPNVPQWSTPPNVQQWGSSGNVPQWGTARNTQQWGSSSNANQWDPSSSAQQWGSSPNANQWIPSSSAQQWVSSPNANQWIPPTNVQRGFSLGPEVETTTIGQVEVSRESEIRTSENVQRGVSPEFGFTNYSSEAQIPRSRPRRVGGLFNLWGNKQGPNLNESHQSRSGSED
ncbi:unnamed protein product [Microthlaspi erraticum]|uniref:Uncharacterized protein n=1 Tax=Microthlaspi erraticum TaxID=1685480 RepID=A0A6D2HGH4_9BRAS|nr:unnamed protein product [Microthlaspi erraticum]CAA7060327.1 unnamed protein product [Microthlaspi erraticum]